METKKLKWHKEIKAWADGAVVEVYQGGEWYVTKFPSWDSATEYRIKPQPKEKKYLYVYSINNDVELDIEPDLPYKYLGKIEVQDD